MTQNTGYLSGSPQREKVMVGDTGGGLSLWALEAVWQRQVCGSKDGFMEVVLGSLEAVSILIVGGVLGGMECQQLHY